MLGFYYYCRIISIIKAGVQVNITVILSSGGIDGYSSSLNYIPEFKLSIISLSNVTPAYHAIEKEQNQIESQLPYNLTAEEKSEKAYEELKKKYPEIANNENLYNMGEFSKNLIQCLEKINT